jgi:hypothetical protein
MDIENENNVNNFCTDEEAEIQSLIVSSVIDTTVKNPKQNQTERRDICRTYSTLFRRRRIHFGPFFTATALLLLLLLLLLGVVYEINERNGTNYANNKDIDEDQYEDVHDDQWTPTQTQTSAIVSDGTSTLPLSSSLALTTVTPLFAFLHMAKTSGTTVNGILASRYHGICGNKGFDYKIFERLNQNYTYVAKDDMDDFWNYSLNKNFNAKKNGYVSKIPPGLQEELLKGAVSYSDGSIVESSPSPNVVNDSTTPTTLIGGTQTSTTTTTTDTCHYLGAELGWHVWRDIAQIVNRPLQLHVPCREPIDHFMSMCNELHVTLDCGKDFATMVQECGKYYHRYNDGLRQPWTATTTRTATNTETAVATASTNTVMTPKEGDYVIDVKCFNVSRRDEYIDWVGERLPKPSKRRHPKQYTFRATNKPRDVQKECIWKDLILRDALRTYLVQNVEYYNFCDSCIGSDDDLLLL